MADLRAIDAEPLGDGIVERLEHCLDRARKGELSSVAIAMVLRDGSSDFRWSELPNRATMMGALSRLIYKLNVQADQG